MESDRFTAVTYDNVSDRLIEHIPELSEAYEAALEWWGNEKPGPHVVYGDILNPYIDRLLQSGDEPSLRRIFHFLEKLSRSEDQRVQEIVSVTVCEQLTNNKERLQEARRFMGSATLKLSDEIEKFWGE